MRLLPRLTKRRILLVFGVGAVIVFALMAYGYFVEPRMLVVTDEEITIDGWDPTFDGLKIVMIADIHGGSNAVDEAKLRQIVELSNGQKPDIVVLLGDYVSQGRGRDPDGKRVLKMPVETVADALAGLNAKYGVFAVLGNHDGWFGDERVAAELTRVGFRVLQNEIAVIEKNGHHLRLLGFKDHLHLEPKWVKLSADTKQMLAASGDGDIIALEHSPDILPSITGELSVSPSLKLILAAHTHGGQVRFPIVGSLVVPSSYGQRYAHGYARDNDVDMFVTSGIGTSVLPFRFMVPPEIMVVTIHSPK